MPKYFETIRDRLNPGGLCVIQAITIADEHFSTYCRRPDFIQRFVFPGGFLPSKRFLRESLARAGSQDCRIGKFWSKLRVDFTRMAEAFSGSMAAN